jgi:phage shock protein PspC (stress-responsive transcriptional regulator)
MFGLIMQNIIKLICLFLLEAFIIIYIIFAWLITEDELVQSERIERAKRYEIIQ